MKVARYEVPGIGKKYDPVPEGRLKSGCAVNYVYRISRLSRIRRPSGTRPFFVCYPGNKLPGYFHSVPSGTKDSSLFLEQARNFFDRKAGHHRFFAFDGCVDDLPLLLLEIQDL